MANANSEFKVRIPIEFESKGKSSGTASQGNGNNKLTGSIIKGGAALGILNTLLQDVYKLIQPLIKVLQTLFVVIFLPIMPLITSLTESIASLIPGIQKLFNGEIDLGEFIKEYLGPAFSDMAETIRNFTINSGKSIAKSFFDLGVQIGDWLTNKLLVPLAKLHMQALMWIANGVMSGIQYIKGIGEWIWNFISNSFNFLKDIGKWIWEMFFLKPLDFLKDLGQKIWNILRKPFEWLADKIRSINIFSGGSKKSVNDAIIRPNGQIIEFSPSDTIFATKNPNKLSGSNQITVNINNPSVRNDQDIKKIADAVSVILNRQLRGRISI